MTFPLIIWSIALAANIIAVASGSVINLLFVIISAIMTGHYLAKYTE